MTIGVAPRRETLRDRSISIDRPITKLKGTPFFFTSNHPNWREITSFVPLNGFPFGRATSVAIRALSPESGSRLKKKKKKKIRLSLDRKLMIRRFVREVVIYPVESRKFPSISYLRKTLPPRFTIRARYWSTMVTHNRVRARCIRYLDSLRVGNNEFLRLILNGFKCLFQEFAVASNRLSVDNEREKKMEKEKINLT